MCGRFALAASPEQLARQFELPLLPPALKPRYNIAPTQPVAVIRIDATAERRRELGVTQWGLVPEWAKDPSIGSRMINARSETLAEKPSFRSAYKRRRCLIPASGFFEWRTTPDKKKQPYFIHPRQNGDGAPAAVTSELFAFAGLWETWFSEDGSEVQTSTIITTAANDIMRDLHHRMPVILEAEQYAGWLDPDTDAPDRLNQYLGQYSSRKMNYYPVDRAMNSPRNDSAACIEAVTLTQSVESKADQELSLFGEL
ncbi:MAG: SOS response-associated peptidase [bacterium]|nr:SOS response-associated peptidase [bacterium]